MGAAELVTLLDRFFNQLDEEAEKWGITKIKTIGLLFSLATRLLLWDCKKLLLFFLLVA